MHLRRLCLALGLFAAIAADGAVIYKWTDADGVVHFSDQAVPGAEKIITSGTSKGIGGSVRAPSGSGVPGTVSPEGVNYTTLSIESPARDQVFFNDEIVPIRLQVEPTLKPHHSLTWHLNGKQLDDQADSKSFSLQSLPRGTYIVAATVTDTVSGESQSSDSVTFYVRQPSELDLQHHKS